MIKAYFHGDKNDTEREFQDAEAFLAALREIPIGTPCEVIVRFPDDASFMRASRWREETQAKAASDVEQLVVRKAAVWQQAYASATAAGWVVIWPHATQQHQPAQPGQPAGPLLGMNGGRR